MTKQEKNQVLESETIAYFSGFGGIEIKSIQYDIEDYVIFVSGAWTGNKQAHKSKIYYSATDNDFFRYGNYRIPLNECIRVF